MSRMGSSQYGSFRADRAEGTLQEWLDFPNVRVVLFFGPLNQRLSSCNSSRGH